MKEITVSKVLEKQDEDSVRMIKSLLRLKEKIMTIGKKKELTADQANIISRFNLQGYSSLEEIAKKKIKEIEEQITSKLQFSHKERLLALIVPDDQRDLYDLIKTHYYTEKGFKTFYLDKERVPEFKNSTYLFISWDIEIKK